MSAATWAKRNQREQERRQVEKDAVVRFFFITRDATSWD